VGPLVHGRRVDAVLIRFPALVGPWIHVGMLGAFWLVDAFALWIQRYVFPPILLKFLIALFSKGPVELSLF
jgi:hypothetical protein